MKKRTAAGASRKYAGQQAKVFVSAVRPDKKAAQSTSSQSGKSEEVRLNKSGIVSNAADERDFEEAYNRGYQEGFVSGFEEGHDFAYRQPI